MGAGYICWAGKALEGVSKHTCNKTSSSSNALWQDCWGWLGVLMKAWKLLLCWPSQQLSFWECDNRCIPVHIYLSVVSIVSSLTPASSSSPSTVVKISCCFDGKSHCTICGCEGFLDDTQLVW